MEKGGNEGEEEEDGEEEKDEEEGYEEEEEIIVVRENLTKSGPNQNIRAKTLLPTVWSEEHQRAQPTRKTSELSTENPFFALRCSPTERRAFRVAAPLPTASAGSSTAKTKAP